MKTGTYTNLRMSIPRIKDTDRVADLRTRVHRKYGIEPSSYLIAWVFDNKVKVMFHNNQQIKEITGQDRGVLLLYEIPKELKPELPPLAQIRKDDSNYGIDESWCKIVVNIFKGG